MLLYEELSGEICGAAIEVHRELGPGLLESVYRQCLCHELQLRDIEFEQEIDLPVKYKGLALDGGYRIDLLVQHKVILELKAVSALLPVHEAQLMTYLKLREMRLGLLINFNVRLLKDGIKRIAM